MSIAEPGMVSFGSSEASVAFSFGEQFNHPLLTHLVGNVQADLLQSSLPGSSLGTLMPTSSS
jgi:hypothetical protein